MCQLCAATGRRRAQNCCTASPTCHRRRRSVGAMLARIATFAIDGVDPRRVLVEVDIRSGLPAFTIVGLGDVAVRESRDRIRSAILNSGFEFPKRRITANLAPAFLRKAGPGFDAALALAVLVASEQVPAHVASRLRGVRRALARRRAAGGSGRARRGRGRQAGRPAAPDRPPRARAGGGDRRRDRSGGRLEPEGRRRAAARWRAAAAAGIDAGGSRPRGRARPGRRARSGGRGAGDRDRRRRRAQPAARGAARHGQDDAGAADPVDPPGDDARRGRGGHAAAQRRRRPHRRAHPQPPVPRPAPHDLAVGAGGRWRNATARGGHARPPRGPVPRRALGVPALRARRPAPAARGRERDDRARSARADLPHPVHARGRHQPLPVRLRRAWGTAAAASRPTCAATAGA